MEVTMSTKIERRTDVNPEDGEREYGNVEFADPVNKKYPIVVARLPSEEGDRIVAFQDHCTHRGGPLADGVLACNLVTCPWHGSQFNVETGEVVSGPAEERIQVYPVRVEDHAVKIVAPEPLAGARIAGASGFIAPEPARPPRQRAGAS
jgi:nitrite reductase/ring-hydroxylating ferredoxin subunit